MTAAARQATTPENLALVQAAAQRTAARANRPAPRPLTPEQRRQRIAVIDQVGVKSSK